MARVFLSTAIVVVVSLSRVEAGGALEGALLNGDVNCSGGVDISDASYLLNWLFLGGQAPCPLADPPHLVEQITTLDAELSQAEAALDECEVNLEHSQVTLIETFPTPTDTAVVVRFPLPGATAAAIAVGLPRQGKVPGISYCFDAADCRLVYAWQGGFLDLSGSLGKRMEYPRLLGEIFYRATRFPLRIGDRDRIPARRFRGYRMVEGFPEFRYEIDGLDIREHIVPSRSGSGFVHEFRIERVDRSMWFVVDENQAVGWTSTVGEFRRTEDGKRGELDIPRGENVRFDVSVIRHESTEPGELDLSDEEGAER